MPTIAYLGPEHTNTHVAAKSRFGRRSKYNHAPTVDAVFHLVERRKVDYGVVPVENSLEGAVTHTLDRFIDFVDSPVKIHGEIEQSIVHFLLMRKGTKLDDIRIVRSHPQALGQCRSWIEKNLPWATLSETRSTSEAVQLLTKPDMWKGYWKNKQLGAIGRPELVTGRNSLESLQIPQDRKNKTRFIVIGLGTPKRGRRNKTSILFSLKDRPGALYDALLPFKRQRINLTKIESRPSKRKAWEYHFFIDLEGHESEDRVTRALEMLKRQADVFQVLGSYPVAARTR